MIPLLNQLWSTGWKSVIFEHLLISAEECSHPLRAICNKKVKIIHFV